MSCFSTYAKSGFLLTWLNFKLAVGSSLETNLQCLDLILSIRVILSEWQSFLNKTKTRGYSQFAPLATH